MKSSAEITKTILKHGTFITNKNYDRFFFFFLLLFVANDRASLPICFKKTNILLFHILYFRLDCKQGESLNPHLSTSQLYNNCYKHDYKGKESSHSNKTI